MTAPTDSYEQKSTTWTAYYRTSTAEENIEFLTKELASTSKLRFIKRRNLKRRLKFWQKYIVAKAKFEEGEK